MDDLGLLLRFANEGSEPAFEELVRKHAPMVYSSARRRAGDECADDVTQAVFLILARKAAWLGRRKITNLAGWLFRATRYAAAEARRSATRRAERERIAQERWTTMDTHSQPDAAADILPLLDAALDTLGRPERDAILLRFFHNASFADVGRSIGVTENTAAQRVGRALDKLRSFFERRGRPVGIPVIMTVLSAQAAEAVPATLVSASVSLATGGAAAAGGSALALAQAAIQGMFVAQLKVIAAAGAAILLAAGTVATLSILPDNDARDVSNTVRFVGVEAFPFQYKGITHMPDGSTQFQVNVRGDTKTYFAAIGQDIGGFRLLAHEEKTSDRIVPGIRNPRSEDVSELTLQRGSRRIVLVRGESNAAPEESCAHVIFRPDGTHRRLCEGDEFEAGDARFRVVSIERGPDRLGLQRLPDGRKTVLTSARE